MIPSFLITFRETLEAALVVGIILSYLKRTHQAEYYNLVTIGIVSGILASILGAFLFVRLAGGFSGRGEQIFESITLLLGAFLLTTMILWMMKQKHIATELQGRVATELAEGHKLGLFLLVFVAVLREGIETVIFLGAARFISTNNNLVGASTGILAAILLGYMIFLGSMKVKLKVFFNVTSILLILFAAGLVAYGVHELQEARIVPKLVEHVWDINPAMNPNGSYPPFHERGYIGSILKGLFGYNGNPSLIETLSYFTYLAVVFILWRRRREA